MTNRNSNCDSDSDRMTVGELVSICEEQGKQGNKPEASEYIEQYDESIHAEQHDAPPVACYLYNTFIELNMDIRKLTSIIEKLSEHDSKISKLLKDVEHIMRQALEINTHMHKMLSSHIVEIGSTPYETYDFLKDWQFAGLPAGYNHRLDEEIGAGPQVDPKEPTKH